MITIKREVFKVDPVWSKLWTAIKQNHKPASHTIKILKENSHKEDFCEESVHFCDIGDKIYLSYNVFSWIKNKEEILVKINSITIYDDWLEWQTCKLKELHSGVPSEGANLN